MRDKMTQILEVIVGLEWGDEGKGKIVDARAAYAMSHYPSKRTVIVRFQGGPNAGHSIYVRRDDSSLQKFVMHAAPSGLTSNTDVAIGPQVAFDPERFIEELNSARSLFNYHGRVLISERTGMLLDYHRKLDAWREQGEQGIGTTKSGIGPFYEDNARRTTRITFHDYISNKLMKRLYEVLKSKQEELIKKEEELKKAEEEQKAAEKPEEKKEEKASAEEKKPATEKKAAEVKKK